MKMATFTVRISDPVWLNAFKDHPHTRGNFADSIARMIRTGWSRRTPDGILRDLSPFVTVTFEGIEDESESSEKQG